jgi:D-alanyl-D-alanine carboxypeptidase
LIHKRCSSSLTRVLNNVWDRLGRDITKVRALKYDVYSGSYNLRLKRGGTTLSMHSYAAAIDWDDPDNPFRSQHHKFTTDELLLVEFRREGWICGIDWSPGSIDAEHVQASRVHP